MKSRLNVIVLLAVLGALTADVQAQRMPPPYFSQFPSVHRVKAEMKGTVEAQQVIADYLSKFDEFYGSNWESAMSRLDNFALDMGNNPHMIGVLIVYGGQRSRRAEASAWSGCLKSYLVSRRGIEPNRIVMINGGYREDLTVELWETADRKHIPNPAPHVKPKDVRFKKGKVIHLCEI